MNNQKLKAKIKEWVKRYLPAEILGTLVALCAASLLYSHTHSYVSAAAAGWFGQGIGFYGYFITTELLHNHRRYRKYSLITRIAKVLATASTNLLIEFAPAEILDNFLIRPYAMYIVPQYIHPYPIGFLIATLGADLLFYIFAIVGYETRKRWSR